MKNSVIAIPSPHVVITTIVHALLVPIFFEMDNTKECKSPCPSSAEMCIAMCA